MDAMRLTAEEIKGKEPVFIPIGAFESHSQMLPLGTDSFIAKAFCQEFVKVAGGMVLPPIDYSCCPHTDNLPGTIAVTHDDFKKYLTGICLALQKQGFRKIILINIHSGNDAIISVLVEEVFSQKGLRLFYFNPYKADAEKVDAQFFKGKDNSFKECSLLLAALEVLGEEGLLKRTLSRAVEEEKEGRPEIETLRRYGKVGFSYKKSSDHVAGRKDASLALGLKYLQAQVNTFKEIIPALESCWKGD